MNAFAPVPCPRCAHPKIGRLPVGNQAEFKCPNCKAWVFAGRDTLGEVLILASGDIVNMKA